MEQELELHRLKSENAELKKRISDFATIENAKKKGVAQPEKLLEQLRADIAAAK